MSLPLLARFPRPSILGMPGVEKYQKRVTFQNAIRSELWKENTDTIEAHAVRGFPANEIVLLHKPSQTLIITDIAFNICNQRGWSKCFFSLSGAHNRFTPTRYAKMAIKDKAAFKKSIDHIAAWDFERIIMAHGDIIEKKGKDLFKQAFAFLDT